MARLNVLSVLLPVFLAFACNVAESRDYACSLRPDSGACRGYFHRYYFDPATGNCRQFIYGGCGGNENNFNSQEECEKKCQVGKSHGPPVLGFQVPERCRYQAETGLCKAYFPSYYFNLKSGQCEFFVYGGCGGNENRFRTKEECEQVCSPVRPKAASAETCRLPAESGPCRAYMLRYFFNHNTGQCETFIYGGCKGNGNNFKDQQECELECLK